VKHCLRGQSFETAGELFSASEVIWMGIEKMTLDVVFLNECRYFGHALQPKVIAFRILHEG
jgi:hypothetical protein